MAQPQQAGSSRSDTRIPLNRRVRALYREARRYLRQWLSDLAETLEPILKPLFAINQASALIRSSIFAAGFLLWLGLAYINQPPALSTIDIGAPAGADPISLMLFQLRFVFAVLVALAVPLFVPAVFRYVLVAVFAFWLASRVAAIYLADIFELPNVAVASKFIRQAAFVTLSPRQYNRLVIREGEVAPQFQQSPIYQIGGPGLVLVNLENVAVFEKVDGTPDVIPPTGRPVVIEGFERLRKIIDLRDQFIEDEVVHGRTKDGIPVSARGIRFSFSVARDNRVRIPDDDWDEEMSQPLSYTEDSILNLVYTRPNEPFDKLASEEIKEEIRKFIGRNSLSQFLADSRPEEEDQENLPSDPTVPITTGDASFKTREAINQELISAFKNRKNRTIDLHWVSVGTWVPPAVIPEKHKEAWQRRARSLAQSEPKALKRLLRQTRLKELVRLIQDVPINAFGHVASQNNDPKQIKRELMLAYREKIKNAYELYRQKQLKPPIQLVAALKHLQRL